MTDDYVIDFVQESEAHITELNNALLVLERTPDDEEAIDGIFRIAHTLKGNCGAMGLTRASDLAHALEDLLDGVRTDSIDVSPELMDTVFDGVDELEAMIAELEATGEIDRDPTETIETIRRQVETAGGDARTQWSAPTDEEIDAVLARFEPPADDHDAFLVRLGIAGDAAANGARVVEALVDAFELLGTDPSREAVENGTYGTQFDAVFASAVGETAIASALEPVDAVDAFEIVTVTDRFADSTGPTPETQAAGGKLSTEDAQDLEVDDLLDEFEEFDDLDSMVEEDDDDLDLFDEMGDAGSFDDLLGDERERVVDDSAPVESAEETAAASESEDDPTAGDANDVFAELKDEVEMVGFDELQDELDELEFDEFDSDDEVGMDELLGDEFDDDDSFLDVGENDLDEQLPPAETDPDEEWTESAAASESTTFEDGVAVDETVGDDAVRADERTGHDEGVVADDDAGSSAGDESEDVVDVAVAESEPATDLETGRDAGDTLEEDPEPAESDVTVSFDETSADERETPTDDDTDERETGTALETSDDTDDEVDHDGTWADDRIEDESAPDPTWGDDLGAFESDADEPVSESAEADLDVGFDDDAADSFGSVDTTADGFDEDANAVTFDPLETDVESDAEFETSADTDTEFETDAGTEFGTDESFIEFDDESDSFDATADVDDSVGFAESSADDESETTDRIVDETAPMQIPDITVPEPSERTAADRESEQQSVRVDVEQVDSLLTLVEGLVTSRVRLRHAIDTGADRQTIARELDDLEGLTADLQETVMDVRLVPLRSAVNRLPRVVRDIAREQGKEVALEISGEDVELDRSILDRIGDPLIHLVRNAVDHGIELPTDREDAEKPPEGSVEVRASRSRDRVQIVVEDDGTGLDPDRLRESAVEADVLTDAEADDLTDGDAYDLVFHPGLSTAEEVTDVSGRGVGMDVVKQTIERLDGTVAVDSEQGDGTTVTMTLPVTVAIADVLFLECGGEEFGIPVKAVQDIESASATETVDGQEVLSTADAELPVVDLADTLDTPRSGTDDGMVVRIRDGVRPVALRCDTVSEQQEVVVKPFEGFMGNVPGLSGATVRGRGKVVTILDVTAL